MRLLIAVAGLVCACGRIGFDPHASDAQTAAPDATFEPNKVGLLAGGDARFVVAPGSTLSRMYVVFGDNHLVRTDDGGITYRDCGFFPRFVTDLAANDSGRVVTATSGGVWESTDSCATFHPVGTITHYMTAVALDGSAILASDSTGLLRWDGATWTSVATPLDNMYINSIVPGEPSLIASGLGIAVSVNAGPYILSNTGLTDPDTLRVARAGSSFYAATAAGVHKSTNGGASWTQVLAGYGDVIAVDPSDPSYVVEASLDGMVVSSNAGASWSGDVRIPSMARSRVQGFAFDPAGSGRLVIATGRGLFAADAHGAPMLPLLSSLDAWTISAIAPDAVGSARYVATTSGELDVMTDELTDTAGFDFTTSRDLLTAGTTRYSAGRVISRRVGVAPFEVLYTPDATDGFWVTRIREDAGTLFAASFTRVMSSPDGATWGGTILPVVVILDLLVIPGAPRQLYAATNDGIHYSSDGGGSFTPTAIVDYSEALAQLPDGSILAGTDLGLRRAAAPGATFGPVSVTGEFRALAMRGTTVYAVIDDTVQMSVDNANTFTTVPGFTGHSPISLHVDPDGTLLVGTIGWGMYRLHP